MEINYLNVKKTLVAYFFNNILPYYFIKNEFIKNGFTVKIARAII